VPDRRRKSSKKSLFNLKKDWPWFALAGIAIGSFFLLHPASPVHGAGKRGGKHSGANRGMATRGSGRYANGGDSGLENDGGPIS
jgi:hypothetical protein